MYRNVVSPSNFSYDVLRNVPITGLKAYTYDFNLGDNRYDFWVAEYLGGDWVNIRNQRTGLYLETSVNGDVNSSSGNQGPQKLWRFTENTLVNKATGKPIEDHLFRFIFETASAGWNRYN